MWILHLLPDSIIAWVVNTILIAGAMVTVAADFYNLPLHIQHEIATLHQFTELKFIRHDHTWKLHIAPDSIKTNQITAAHYNVLQKDINLYNHLLEIFDQANYDISATKIQQSIGLS